MTGINRGAVGRTSGGKLLAPVTIRRSVLQRSALYRRIELNGSPPMAGSDSSYDPNKLGWGFAAVIIALAIVANVTAYSIHKATYQKPDKPATAQAAH
jgi:hypothetical protein